MFIKPVRLTFAVIGLLSLFGLNFIGASSSTAYSIAPGEFIPNNNYCTYNNEIYHLTYYYNSGIGCNIFFVGIHLPDGATITKITMFYKDNSPDHNMELGMYSSGMQGDIHHILNLDTSGNSNTPTSVSVNTSIPITNSTTSYHFELGFEIEGENIDFYGVELETTYPLFAPLVRK